MFRTYNNITDYECLFVVRKLTQLEFILTKETLII